MRRLFAIGHMWIDCCRAVEDSAQNRFDEAIQGGKTDF
jgi:hypothetical protein